MRRPAGVRNAATGAAETPGNGECTLPAQRAKANDFNQRLTPAPWGGPTPGAASSGTPASQGRARKQTLA
eukprot:6305486-Alexandrium_andersonii.AAC.1